MKALYYAAVLGISYCGPVIIWLYLRRKKGAAVKPLLVGMLSYSVLISVPRQAARMVILTEEVRQVLWLKYLLSGLLSGVFEEIGRYLVFKHLLDEYDDWSDCAAYALGHSAIEIILTHKMWENDIGGSVLEIFGFGSAFAFSFAMSVLAFGVVHYAMGKGLIAAAIGMHAFFDFVPVLYFGGVIGVGSLLLIDTLLVAEACCVAYLVYRHTE